MKKLSNEEKYENFKKREKISIAIIINSIITIILAILSLVIKLDITFALIFFCITYILKNKIAKLEDEVKEPEKDKKNKKK